MKNTTTRLDLKPIQQMLRSRGLETNGYVQKAFTNEVYKHSEPYTPLRTGTLKRNVQLGNDFIKYNSPYARYLYYGKVMVGSAPKQVTDKDLTYQGAPMRGAFWVKRMWTDKGQNIVSGLARLAGGKAK